MSSKARGGWSLVRLLSIQARNFKKLHLDDPVQFSDGITLITGLNESGKSSVLDAILYALFGRVNRPPKAKNEDLVAYGTKEAVVSLDFEVGERRFRVSRRLSKTKPTRASLDEVRMKGSPQTLASGQEKVNEEIVRLLGGITYQEIVSSTVVAQKELNKLIELNKDDRKKIINAFLNLESFNFVMTDLVEERRNLEGSSSRVGRLHAEREKLELLKRELDEYQKSNQEKTRLVNESSKLDESAKELQVKFNEKDQMYSDLRKYETAVKTRESLASQLNSKKKLLDDQRTRMERLRKEIDSVREELERFTTYDKAEPTLVELRSRLEKAKSWSLELSAAERSWRTLNQEVLELSQKLGSNDEAKLRDTRSQVSKPILPYVLLSALFFVVAFVAFTLDNLIAAFVMIAAALMPAIIVGVRLNAASSLAKHQSVLGDLGYLDAKRHDLTSVEQHQTQARQEFESSQRELEIICGKLQSYGNMFRLPAQGGALEAAQIILDSSGKDLHAREALRVKVQTLNDEAGKLPREAEMSGLENEMTDLEQRINELVLPALRDGIVFVPELVSATLIARDELSRQLTSTQSKFEQNLQRVRELEKYLSEHAGIPSSVQSQEQLVGELDHRLRVIKRAIEGVQATGESLRNRIRPNVQGYMSAVLPALTSSKYRAAVLDDDYNLQVWDPEAGEYRPKEVYSGGTEDQFLLAMRLSFALALLPEVKGQKPEFVFLDEPLGSSDEVRRSGIVDYLAQDLSKKFKQIFIISHVGGLEEHVQNIVSLEDGRVA